MAASRISQIAAHLNFPQGMLAGQVAIITGSGQGIGAEAARLFANEGALVVVSDIDADKATSVAESINSAGGKALAVPGDMLDSKYIQTLVDKASEFGSGKIHIIVNNAGTYIYTHASIESTLPFSAAHASTSTVLVDRSVCPLTTATHH
jgi:3-oxoacyl-[acyl-carrier protein] reductase